MCVMCGKEHELKLVKFEDTLTFKGVEITFETESYYCVEYDDYFDDEALVRTNDTSMKDAYREKVGLLTSTEIKAIREKYGISQKDMGFIMGWGTATFGRYETSQVQDEAHNDLLLLISNPEWLRDKMESKRDYIIENKGEDFYYKHYQSVFKLAVESEIKKEKKLLGALSGKKVKLSNVNEVANYFLSKETMSNLKLQKMVYLAYGHIAALMNDSCEKMKVALFAKPMEGWVHGPVVPSLYQTYSKYGSDDIPSPNNSAFNISEATALMLNLVWDKYGLMSAKELEHLSHQQTPWLNARGDLGQFESGNTELEYCDIYEWFSKDKLLP